MSADKSMRLKPSARLQRFLGRELIGDPNLALLEFVKNSYDAGASSVIVDFQFTTSPSSLVIADNGIGMNEESFRFNWLRPGFSQKSSEYRNDGPRISPEREPVRHASDREPAGEKGLGRLAAGRIGDIMIVWSRMHETDQWLKVTFDWSTFDNMYVAMDEIDIPFEHVDDGPRDAFAYGTVVEILGLRQTWVGRVPGRPAKGRPRTRLGRLRQDLGFLTRASSKSRHFDILLNSDSVAAPADVGIIESHNSGQESADYVYAFNLRLVENESSSAARNELDGGTAGGPDRDEGQGQGPTDDTFPRTVQVHSIRTLQRLKAEGSPTQNLEPSPVSDLSAQDWPGEFSGVFTYTPPQAAKRAAEIDYAPAGVLVYRDDVLVEPYGLSDNDWLGVGARKASRQGHAAVQPSTFSGEVNISRQGNANLVDMSNRLGLLENEASTLFIELVRQEFDTFESILYEEVLRENWKGSSEERAARQAELAEQVTHIRLRSLAHRAGQPLQALGFELVSLQLFAENEAFPREIREEVEARTKRMEENLDRLARVIAQITDTKPPRAAEIDVTSLIGDVVREVAGFAQNKVTQLIVDDTTQETIFAPYTLVFEALTELVMNAIEVPRSSVLPEVRLRAESRSDHVAIFVVDNGDGFDQDVDVGNIASIRSVKGRPAEGLANAENAIVASRGGLYIQRLTPRGSAIEVRLSRNSSPVLTTP